MEYGRVIGISFAVDVVRSYAGPWKSHYNLLLGRTHDIVRVYDKDIGTVSTKN